jgi:hypothetical protein
MYFYNPRDTGNKFLVCVDKKHVRKKGGEITM